MGKTSDRNVLARWTWAQTRSEGDGVDKYSGSKGLFILSFILPSDYAHSIRLLLGLRPLQVYWFTISYVMADIGMALSAYAHDLLYWPYRSGRL